jgi:GTP pyrophosphokinase
MTELKLDQAMQVTALLHDTVEDTLATVDEIERLFGADVARLVDGVTALSKIETMSDNERAAENLRKFLAMSEDLRVLLVKLADRLHNMRTLHFIKSEEKRRRIARETMDIYAPLAERVGMYEYMREMQLLAFEQLEPEAYATIRASGRDPQRGERAGRAIALEIKQALAEAGLRVEVSGREKHPYSIWKKMAERHVSFEQITDIMAFRVLTENEDDCYKALGILHRTWQMIPGPVQGLHLHAEDERLQEPAHLADLQQRDARGSADQDARDARDQRIRPGRTGPTSRGATPDGQWAGCAICSKSSKPATIPRNCSKTPRWRSIRIASSPSRPRARCSSCPRARRRSISPCRAHQSGRAGGGRQDQRAPRAAAHAAGQRRCGGDHQEPHLETRSFPGWPLPSGQGAASIRRSCAEERAEVAAIGRKLYEEIVERLPGTVGKKALADAIKRLKMAGEEDLMFAIGSAKVDDRQVMEALMPGSAANLPDPDHWPKQKRAIAVRGLTPGMAFQLAACCHPVPGDRIVGLPRRAGRGGPCDRLPQPCQRDRCRLDRPFVGPRTDGAIRPLRRTLQSPRHAGRDGGDLRQNHANVVNLEMTARKPVPYLRGGSGSARSGAPDAHRALRASDAVAQAEQI